MNCGRFSVSVLNVPSHAYSVLYEACQRQEKPRSSVDFYLELLIIHHIIDNLKAATLILQSKFCKANFKYMGKDFDKRFGSDRTNDVELHRTHQNAQISLVKKKTPFKLSPSSFVEIKKKLVDGLMNTDFKAREHPFSCKSLKRHEKKLNWLNRHKMHVRQWLQTFLCVLYVCRMSCKSEMSKWLRIQSSVCLCH